MGFFKNIFLIILNIVIASLLTILYWLLGGLFLWLTNHNWVTAILSCFLYIGLGFLFFSFKYSKHNGIYGALEVTLGLATFFVPFLFKMEISEGLLTKSLPSYLAFYAGIYLQVRGYDSIYKNWKEQPSKYGWLFNTLFNLLEEPKATKNQEQNTKQREKYRILKRVVYILLLFAVGGIISFIVFNTITDSTDVNNVYYIFSTGAQTIAALVGFVLAAYTFNHQFMWNARDSGEGTSEIIDETIRVYYKYIMILSSATGITLIADLCILQVNAVELLQIKPIIYIIVGSLNVFIIIAAFLIALYIIRPINIEEWAKNLFEERLREKHDRPELTVEIGQFLQAFISLEQLCRKYLSENEQILHVMGMGKMARILYEKGKIDGITIEELLEIIKYRNLVVHGHIPKVESDMYSKLQELNKKMKQILYDE
ncbi:hypothetical protein COF61_09210 [Bacillus toyonensis]|uniref:hypothetical protein n=1 Tax=Bacillus toyonensis TaxID=155322 RepID=UPI000BFB6095|nr:hypothetical protein [Bacillus toyonensis]PHD66630.1 hypothetical protein COF61_09210 [Bacillus toyonensis]